MKPIADQITKMREELDELEQCLPNWTDSAGNIAGARKYRSVVKRIVLSAHYLEESVRENTLSR